MGGTKNVTDREQTEKINTEVTLPALPMHRRESGPLLAFYGVQLSSDINVTNQNFSEKQKYNTRLSLYLYQILLLNLENTNFYVGNK